MYALCLFGAENTQGFVWKFYIYIHNFIHSFILLVFLKEKLKCLKGA